LPLLDEPGFRPQLERYIRERGIDLVFPTMERVVTEFSRWSLPGVRFVGPSPEVAETAQSKQKTYEALAGVVPLPEIYAGDVTEFPVYAKPPAGSGGRGNRLIRDERELQAAREEGLLTCEYLPGEEMVAYSLGDPEGRQLTCITKKMGGWRGGSSFIGAIHDEPVVRGHAAAIARRLRLVGPWFAQFRQDRFGAYKLMEVNARLGGGAGLCRLAGVNFPLLAVRAFAGQTVSIPSPIPSVQWVRSLRPAVSTDAFDRVVWDIRALCRESDGKARPQVIAMLFDLANRGVRQDGYGQAVPDVVSRWNLESHFHARHQALRDALAMLERPDRAVFVTDDPADRCTISAASPATRVVAVAALELLGAERL
jgi:carbamoyl-phosphate synthase large subunit